MANIKVTLDYPIHDGLSVTFKAPCDCTEVTGLIIYYPELTEDSKTTTSKVFTFRDAHENDLTNIGNLFTTNSYVKAVLNTTNGYAYLQNADTNAYLENALNNKTSKPKVVTSGTEITLEDNTKYTLTNVSTLTFIAPSYSDYGCFGAIETAVSGAITITLPSGATIIGDAPTFANDEKWEFSVWNNRWVWAKAEVV